MLFSFSGTSGKNASWQGWLPLHVFNLSVNALGFTYGRVSQVNGSRQSFARTSDSILLPLIYKSASSFLIK
jgi:hypothetical protein